MDYSRVTDQEIRDWINNRQNCLCDLHGDGSGYGSGNGYGISKFENFSVCVIDNIYTIITNIKGNIASGYILNTDLSLTPTYIAKNDKFFSHGKSVKEAMFDCHQKYILSLNINEKIESFRKEFNNTEKYDAILFYKWHNLLTGSCKQGRDNFCNNHSINIDTDKFSVKEFIEICRDNYGYDTIKLLYKYYN